jgi:methylated-DNA-[protein]-cysteine S-methyltransferase
MIHWHSFATPFGTVRIAASRKGLVMLSWQPMSDNAFVMQLECRHPQVRITYGSDELERVETQLLEYFKEKRRDFDVAVDLTGMTDFQCAVLGAVSFVEFGTITTYSEIANRIGRPKAARAVGNALGSNPVAIIVPCHRVVRSDGSLGGYTSGIQYKTLLLDIERAMEF